MILLRMYLLAGLVAHKVVWERLKRRQVEATCAPGPTAEAPRFVVLAQAAKLVILLGLAAQTLLPDVLPITAAAAPLRVIGVALFTVGLGVAVLGRVELGTNWADIEAAQVLQHQTVVSAGLYRYIRHPIYAGDLLLLLGFEMSLNSWLVLGVVLLAPFVVQRAVREERMLTAALPGYAAYCAHTKRFIPYVV